MLGSDHWKTCNQYDEMSHACNQLGCCGCPYNGIAEMTDAEMNEEAA